MALRLHRGAAERVFTAGVPVIAIYPGATAGMIYNPIPKTWETAEPLSLPGVLYVDLTGPAAVATTETTFALLPGQTFNIPPGCGNVWVNSEVSGHRFAAVALVSDPGDVVRFPPGIAEGPTTRQETVPSYLYKQYEDDDDLQGFVQAFNEYTQAFVAWFNALNLPIYPLHEGALLDWVANGLYGVARPTLYSGKNRIKGPLNTYEIGDVVPLASRKASYDFTNVAATNDDIYKRIITWHFFKGDGKQVSLEWMKKRVARFLFVADGWGGDAQKSQVSVIISGRNQITITIVSGLRYLRKSASFGEAMFADLDTGLIGGASTDLESFEIPEMAARFIEAIYTGALQTPAQFEVTARIANLGVV